MIDNIEKLKEIKKLIDKWCWKPLMGWKQMNYWEKFSLKNCKVYFFESS